MANGLGIAGALLGGGIEGFQEARKSRQEQERIDLGKQAEQRARVGASLEFLKAMPDFAKLGPESSGPVFDAYMAGARALGLDVSEWEPLKQSFTRIPGVAKLSQKVVLGTATEEEEGQLQLLDPNAYKFAIASRTERRGQKFGGKLEGAPTGMEGFAAVEKAGAEVGATAEETSKIAESRALTEQRLRPPEQNVNESVKLRESARRALTRLRAWDAGVLPEKNLTPEDLEWAGLLRGEPGDTDRYEDLVQVVRGGAETPGAAVAPIIRQEAPTPPRRTGRLPGFGAPAPTKPGATPKGQYRSAEDVRAAFKAGKVSRDEAKRILKDQFGIGK